MVSRSEDSIQQTMRERMLAGALYTPFGDAELSAMALRAQQILHDFNHSLPNETPKRRSLLQSLFKSIGSNCIIQPPFFCDYGVHITCGHDVFINFGCTILDCNEVFIGDRVLFGPNVQIYPATHPTDPEPRKEGWEFALPIKIEDDVWVGGSAVVCPGVTIGKGSTIGAGSVVTKDIPANVVAVGNPCRVIRKL